MSIIVTKTARKAVLHIVIIAKRFSQTCFSQDLAQVNVEDAQGDGVDYNDNFVFDYTFNTFEEAIDHSNELVYGLGLGFHLVKYRYHMEKRPPYKIVACERSGPYKSHAKDPENPQRKSKTKRFEYPFAIRVINRSSSVWEVAPKCGFHNHKFGKFLEGHRRRAKLADETDRIY
ncbi:uncharacterized protein LOC141639778 [Silene latifolia]|uniref:uncharacterized protein LOC141639778 n=1 Tax=Silene latifolia TaxID=37657 RepID=UPI003D789422